MSSPIESPFEKLLAHLVDGGVAFVTVGGVAVALNGFVRLTDDVDILVEPSEENITRLLRSLAGFGEGHARELAPSDFTDEEGAIRVVEDRENCQVDLFTRMGGRRYADLQSHVRYLQSSGARIPYLDAEGLILLKQGSVREKDRIDVAVLCDLIRKRPDAGSP